ncbi:hypothetical protein HMPREF0742_01086 [Rothia aeria F0184]|uniref:Uncharacterized protein n=1 Tax=Rothia aeria F0184 TaxID=888019 RepID=U7V6L9_9MICC|nr:hypothetical protein HMPREF0742_01086 [Rothia aeria F0184]
MVTLSSIFTDFYGVPVIFLNTHCWRLKGAEEAATPAVQVVRRTSLLALVCEESLSKCGSCTIHTLYC